MAVKGMSHFTIKLPMYAEYEVIATQELYDPEYGCDYKFGMTSFVYLKNNHILGYESICGSRRKLESDDVKNRFKKWKERIVEDGKI